jgi:DNA-binding MarR family transcriptional regulator
VPAAHWAFVTNHARVLATISADPTIRIRDLAAHVGLTDRGVTRIISDLEAEGYLTATRIGRRNRYTVNRRAPLRPESEAHRTVAELIAFLGIKPAAF